MTKVLSAVAPIAGAGIGFLTGGPAGAALGLGLGSAAGGAVSALNPPGNAGNNNAGNNAAGFPAIPFRTADELDPFLERLYPPVPAATAAAPAPAAAPVIAPGEAPGGGQSLRQMQDFMSGLAAQGVDINAPDFYKNPQWTEYINKDLAQLKPVLDAQQRQYEAEGYVGPVGWKTPPASPNSGGIGGMPSIATPQINVSTPAFNVAGGVLSKTNSPVQQEFAKRFPEQLAALDQLRAQVAPNMSLARQAALGQVKDTARQAQGNLRQQMARRGVLGSSFGQSAESQMTAEFTKQAAQVEVQAAQMELELTTKFIDMQRSFMAEALTRDLAELGVAAEIGIAGGRIAADIAGIQAQLAAAELQARTQLNTANIAAEASRYASDAGVRSTGISAGASMTNAELAARSGIIQAGLGAGSSALGYQTQASIAANQLSSQEAAGRANLFGNLAGLGLGAWMNRPQTQAFSNLAPFSNGIRGFNYNSLGFG